MESHSVKKYIAVKKTVLEICECGGARLLYELEDGRMVECILPSKEDWQDTDEDVGYRSVLSSI